MASHGVFALNKFLEILNELKELIWIPSQVDFEFLKNRPSVIHGQDEIYSNAKNIIEGISTYLAEEIRKKLRIKDHPYIDVGEIRGKIDETLQEIIEELDKQKNEHEINLKKDSLLENLSDLFNDKIGRLYDDEELDVIYQDGEDRYRNRIPPGYMDNEGSNKKEGNEIYGDLIIWIQMIEKAKDIGVPIIFITNDDKEDWWWITKGKTIGPRPELIKEIRNESKVPFHMYNTKRFMEFAKKYLGIDVGQEAINEVKDLSIKVNENIYITDFTTKINLEMNKLIHGYYEPEFIKDKILWDLIESKWPEILIEIRGHFPKAAEYLISSSHKKVEDSNLIIEFKSELIQRRVKQYQWAIEEIIGKIIGFPIKISFISTE